MKIVTFATDAEVKKTDALSPLSQLCYEDDSFPTAIWPVLAVAQCFGLMPVVGIHSLDQAKIAFRWRTLRTMVTGVYLVLAVVNTSLFLKHIAYLGINARNTVGLVYFSCSCLIGFLFLFLARRWKILVSNWCKLEAVFLSYPYACSGYKLSKKIRLTAAIFFSLALFEHMMYFSSNMYNFYKRIHSCNWNTDDLWRIYFLAEFKHIFKIIPYHFLVPVIILCLNFAFTFAWNYMDIFVMLASIALSTRFQQLNFRISRLRSEEPNNIIWSEIRLHYVQLCELLATVDSTLSAIILLSFSNNLYFVCFQLLNIFNSLPYTINYLYFWYSLLYLIGRCTCVLLCASSIHDASRKPLQYIRNMNSNIWCSELKRFNDQVSTETIALTGMKFFNITRKLLVGMAGTIVTYELVMLQIDSRTIKTADDGYCDRSNYQYV